MGFFSPFLITISDEPLVIHYFNYTFVTASADYRSFCKVVHDVCTACFNHVSFDFISDERDSFACIFFNVIANVSFAVFCFVQFISCILYFRIVLVFYSHSFNYFYSWELSISFYGYNV